MTQKEWSSHVTGKALILGMGASGLACARHLAKRGFALVVADTRLSPPNADAIFAISPEAELIMGQLPERLDDQITMVVVSPGLSLYTGPSGALIAQARAKGIEVLGELELFARELERLRLEEGYSPQVIGVTGTYGKTTSVTLMATLLRAAGKRVALAGNVGPNALDVLASALEGPHWPEAWVLELSSFQLASTTSLRLDVALLTNITEDHVDWHGSMAVYAEDKCRIFHHALVGVINRQDPLTMEVRDAIRVPRLVTIGEDVPCHDGDWGLSPEKAGTSSLWLGQCQSGEFVPFCPEEALQLAGRHNTLNVLGVLAMLKAVGVDLQTVLSALKGYQGEPHRVQPMFEADGVLVVDDSKGTNVGAVVAAIKGLAARGRRILIVLGGDGKGQDFTPLAEVLQAHAGAVALIGRDAPKIQAAIEPAKVPMKSCFGMAEAVTWLWSQHKSGDVLLLSPGCASWDMYRNYAERSEDFIKCARFVTGVDER